MLSNTATYNTTKPYKVITTLSAIVLTLFIAFFAYDYLRYTLPPKLVDVSMTYLPDTSCRDDSPLYMLITNDSYRTIINTSFTLVVKKRYNNDSFLQLLKKDYSTDTAIESSSSYGGCWSFPKLNTNYYVAEDLIYEIHNQRVVFND